MTVYLYALRERDDDEVRYVGITDSPDRRLHHHRNIGSHLPSSRWARSHDVVMDVLARFETREEACLAEIEEIARRRDAGERLLNLHQGGTGGQMAPETRAKIAAAVRARGPVSEETRERQRQAALRRAPGGGMTGKVQSAETRARMSAALLALPDGVLAAGGRKNRGRARPDVAERNRRGLDA